MVVRFASVTQWKGIKYCMHELCLVFDGVRRLASQLITAHVLGRGFLLLKVVIILIVSPLSKADVVSWYTSSSLLYSLLYC
jgi:hypothetical protein